MKQARLFRIRGKVQGVNYRLFSKTCADALGVTGWIANKDDGSVEAHAEGAADQLEEFAFDLSRGARYARVEAVDSEEAELQELEGFEIRR